MKKGLILIVTLLAISSIMAAMAFTTATVTNDSQIKLTSTDKTLLAIAPAGSDDDAVIQIKNGEATFNFGAGRNKAMFGFQPNSVYHYDYFVHVMNNSANPVQARIRLDESFGNYADFITIKHATGNGVTLVKDGDTVGAVVLNAGENNQGNHANLSLTITIPSAEDLAKKGINLSETPLSGKIYIDAVRYEGAGSSYPGYGY